MSAKEILKEIFESYESLKEICDAAENRVKRGDRRFGEKLGVIPKSGKKEKQKETEAYFDSLCERIEEHYALELISTFEGLVFDRLGDTAGVIRRVVKSGYEKMRKNHKPTPLYHSASAFIKTREDIRSLSGASNILGKQIKQISEELHEELEEIIDYRNWLSHGKNYGKREGIKEPGIKPEIEDIYNILIRIIEEVSEYRTKNGFRVGSAGNPADSRHFRPE
ncbi:hypothetical protein QUF72_07840 [Desulfobacterales bacterium HSG2]|nr:hypothetical protein [Desulfobacterales bacterium HSG2]